MSATYSRMPTLSGAMVGWEGPVPPLEDFLVPLGRLPRFAGHTRWPFTVLHHSLHVAWLALEFAADVAPLALVHDFAEILTGDVPTPFKPEAWKPLERAFVERVCIEWGWEPQAAGGLDWDQAWEGVHALDAMALQSEGRSLTRGVWTPSTQAWVVYARNFPEPKLRTGELPGMEVAHMLARRLFPNVMRRRMPETPDSGLIV